MNPQENNEPTKTTSDTDKRGVMDVQSPRPQHAPSSVIRPEPNEDKPVEPQKTEGDTPPLAQPPAEPTAPENQKPDLRPTMHLEDVEHEAPQSGLSPELLAQAEKETAKPDTSKQELLAAHASHKRRGPLTAVIVAIIIAASLIGVAVYAYMQSQDDGNDATDTSIQEGHDSPEPSAPQPATTEEVDGITKDVDEAINSTDEAQEIPESGLNEEAVGL